MEIMNSTHEDMDAIFQLYEAGTAYMKQVARKHWQGFDRNMVAREITEGRQWKILVDGVVACVFVTTFHDPLIWQEKDKDPAIYLHRIATHPAFRGQGMVRHIAAWAATHARKHNKQYIRMDTGSGNDKLNQYYISCGFTYLGIVATPDTPELPAHYRNGSSSLFEIKLPPAAVTS
ncbi:GNAT family N-acetyltransferase [Chitinophaga solisilvae]|uniref:GNAT family N-acetyltransferase n=1 Tax=Chitinophaga solisilvae TaxID=1233460 RepID=A0A3S1D414_9BACT|nr:GNAT family N-acetyltransferase [Chitinophaga solisilvae]NSL87671.1 GNAT family N-acetyltransferase [Chitinophaga solisilvae]